MIETNTIEYKHNGTILKGVMAYDNSDKDKKPAVLVAHDWSGCNDFAIDKAKKLAELGYVGFAVDMYGDGQVAKDNDAKLALMQPLINDRSLLQGRMQAALDVVSSNELVDANKVATIGYCFGGLCALDLARSGANIQGAVSFHGLLFAPENSKTQNLNAKVLVLHGNDDPMVPKEQVNGFEKEMNAAKADWQFHAFGGAMHAFTNPLANDHDFGTVYNESADKRSWFLTQNFLKEIF